MRERRTHLRRLSALCLGLAALSLMASGCSRFTSEEADPTPKPVAQYNGQVPTLEQLEAIMPTPEQLGAGYVIVEPSASSEAPSASDSEFESAFMAACSDAAALVTDDASGPGVKRDFKNESGQTLTITLAPQLGDQDISSEEELEAAVFAFNRCEPVAMDINGVPSELQLRASKDPNHGDFGLAVYFDLIMHVEGLAQPVVMKSFVRLFSVGKVDIQISEMSDLDQITLQQKSPDYGTVDRLSKQLEEKAAALQTTA